MLRSRPSPRTFMPSLPLSSYLIPVLLLLGSNVFMTFAWYGHLKYKSAPLLAVILVSWGIAFFEYVLMVPANRMGSNVYSVVQLKTIQEIITLVVFAGFSACHPGPAAEVEPLRRLRPDRRRGISHVLRRPCRGALRRRRGVFRSGSSPPGCP